MAADARAAVLKKRTDALKASIAKAVADAAAGRAADLEAIQLAATAAARAILVANRLAETAAK
jgi:hypothetical protein